MSWKAQQDGVLNDLVQRQKELSQGETESQAVLLPVPSGWGRTALLNRFEEIIRADEDHLAQVVRIDGMSVPGGLGLQVQALREIFLEAGIIRRAAERLGIDRPGGLVQAGLGVASLFFSQLIGAAAFVVANAIAVAERVWDDSPAGQEGVLARTGRIAAALSVSLPVVVLIDNADCLERDIALTLIENLIERPNGRVLVVVNVDPRGELLSALIPQARNGLTGRIRKAQINPNMGFQARVELATEMCPTLPAIASRRIGRRVRTFAEVAAVVSADRLTDLNVARDDAHVLAIVDEVIDARVTQVEPSDEAVVLAWAHGVLHAAQVESALTALDSRRSSSRSRDVVRSGSVSRLADSASPLLKLQVRALSNKRRHEMARRVLDVAVRLGEDPHISLLERIVAWQGAHRVRDDVEDYKLLMSVQCQLVQGLETLGDPSAAYEVAHTALTDDRSKSLDAEIRRDHGELSTAVLRLARVDAHNRSDPLVESTISLAQEGGAAIGIEARLWAAIDLLDEPDRRDAALRITKKVIAELESSTDSLGPLGIQWRLLLAFQVGRVGHRDLTQRLLDPMLNTGSSEQQDAAQAVLFAVAGPHADTRLQIAMLESDLRTLPENENDEHLRIHSALVTAYSRLGDYRKALNHSKREFSMHLRMEGREHRNTLSSRSDIAYLTGRCGRADEALRLFSQLLTDQERVLGREHPDTLSTRSNVAEWTGKSGHAEKALSLAKNLLPDQMRVLGRNDPDTLTTRSHVAYWTGKSGRPGEALRLSKNLLSDQMRILGREHPDTLAARSNISMWTAEAGRFGDALRLSQNLLHDQEQILGPEHPDTITTRNNIAALTGQCGHPEEALRLSENLLPDEEWILGPDHPLTLATRSNIAAFTSRCGRKEQALRLFKEVLPDQVRVLGPNHPDTVRTRNNIAILTRR